MSEHRWGAAARERVVVIGAGALGLVLGTALADSGLDVKVCGRRSVPAVTITDADGRTRTHRLVVVTDPQQVSPADVIFLTTKVPDTRAAAVQWLPATITEHTTVVVVQNGIDHRAHLDGLVDAAHVLPALAYILAERHGDRAVTHYRGDWLVVPAGPGAEALAGLFEPSAIQVRIEPDFLTASWRKLLTNAVASPITTLTGRRMDVFGLSNVRALAIAMLREAVQAGRSAGAALTEADMDATLQLIDQMPGTGGSSMLTDREAGRRLEHEYLTGAVVRTAADHGLATPLNHAVLTLLTAVDGAGSADPSGSEPSTSAKP